MNLDPLRLQIEEELRALEAQDEETKASRAPVELDQQSVGRLSRMDAMQVQAMSAETHRRRSVRITALRSALKRIDGDDFGFCAICDEEIPEKRLTLDPMLTTCDGCASNLHG